MLTYWVPFSLLFYYLFLLGLKVLKSPSENLQKPCKHKVKKKNTQLGPYIWTLTQFS